jgi:thiol-disulfide isomerase/thioredoxin
MRRYLLVFLMFLSVDLWSQEQLKGQNAREISLADPIGDTRTLSSLKGKVVLVDFWASWCVPCRRSNKDLLPIYEKYRSRGFEIFAVSIDDNANQWRKAIAADKITWIQVHQKGGWNAPIVNEWQIDQLPTSFLIDKTGKVVAISPGKKELQKQLDALL